MEDQFQRLKQTRGVSVKNKVRHNLYFSVSLYPNKLFKIKTI